MRTLFLLLALLPSIAGATMAADVAGMDTSQEARYRTLIHELRCLVCQNQNIADSDAPLANDLRHQVRRQILAGESNQEIMDYLTQRYGDFVLYNPPFKMITLLLWLGPAVLVLLALVMAYLFTRRTRKPSTATALDEEKLRKLLDENK
ncbi:cytochrome c-type biogenesis protein [Stenotrophobium rhamnosiphilum]|uniref:Cytochrome c-type biogenesis protein n=1 Tax=Stenotrophobium rhamnosiphilum TaxID=2029166 RepID=A0A2T5MHB2_9GAMM|nr:cytochrome c-type biogenesis protein [Stenotrophobium rhamnosiphilum]PTU31968.1 cytochrome c-type biogenesis protein CcmH [Stenotrophobium rhamnosiphilum]